MKLVCIFIMLTKMQLTEYGMNTIPKLYTGPHKSTLNKLVTMDGIC